MPRSTRPFRLLALAALALCAALAAPARAQDPSSVVYDRASVSRIDITIDPDSLQWVFDHPLSDREVPADFRFTRGALVEDVPNVGFRLRGNTSRASQKKSFKVSFNTFVQGRAWRGLEKLNVNGEHNDPTVSRSVIAWGLFARAGAVAPRAAHTELWVNGDYFGLYADVEHVDETFLGRRFGTQDGLLFKCLFPADLAYRSPTGAGYRHTDGNGRPVYELVQSSLPEAEAYDALAAFVSVLTQTPDAAFPAAIAEAFDVNAFLRTLAAEVVVGSWDNYWFNKNNYYLRVDAETRRVSYLSYDLDNTFGIDFVDRDWGTRNPYTWGSNSASEERPLVRRILAVPEFRARYTFYVRRLLAEAFTPERLNPEIAAVEAQVSAAAEADPFRPLDYGYTAADFHRSFREALGGHAEYGLVPYVATRRQTLLSLLDATNVPPIADRPTASPARPRPADAVTVTARVEDEALASVSLAATFGGTAITTPMRDDGTEGDAVAGDDVFTAVLPALGSEGTLTLAARATDAAGQVRTSATTTVAVAALGGGLVVNEFMASNQTTIFDEAGDAADWVEIHNPTGAPVSLLGYTMTDNLTTPDEWAFPDTTLAAGGYLIVWTDDEPEEGPLHANFALGASGDAVGLFLAGVQVDAVTFGPQTGDVATGRFPDATGPFVEMSTPTPGSVNLGTVAAEPLPETLAARAFPNPFGRVLTVETGAPLPVGAEASVFDALGRLVARLDAPAGATRVVWDAAAAPAGVYVVRLRAGDRVWSVRAVRR